VSPLAAPSQFEDDALLGKALGGLLEARLAAAGLKTPTIRGIPPVLPYLLSKDPQSPRELIRSALKLRDTDMMKRFRDWKNSCAEDFRRTLTIRPDVERVIITVADAIRATLTPASHSATFMFDFVPECDHVKMLYHLQLADRSMAFVDRDESLKRQLEAIWRTH
jgi:hypothetical protein